MERKDEFDRIESLMIENNKLHKADLISLKEYMENLSKLHDKLRYLMMDDEQKKIFNREPDGTTVARLRSQIDKLFDDN